MNSQLTATCRVGVVETNSSVYACVSVVPLLVGVQRSGSCTCHTCRYHNICPIHYWQSSLRVSYPKCNIIKKIQIHCQDQNLQKIWEMWCRWAGGYANSKPQACHQNITSITPGVCAKRLVWFNLGQTCLTAWTTGAPHSQCLKSLYDVLNPLKCCRWAGDSTDGRS